jgi:hypothetical protein
MDDNSDDEYFLPSLKDNFLDLPLHCPTYHKPPHRVPSPYNDSLNSVESTDLELSDELGSSHREITLVRLLNRTLGRWTDVFDLPGREALTTSVREQFHLQAPRTWATLGTVVAYEPPRAARLRRASEAEVQPRQGRRAYEKAGALLLLL